MATEDEGISPRQLSPATSNAATRDNGGTDALASAAVTSNTADDREHSNSQVSQQNDGRHVQLEGISPQHSRPRRPSSLRSRHMRERSNSQYAIPDDWANLDELAVTSPVENIDETYVYHHRSLEQTRTSERQRRASISESVPAGGILESDIESAVARGTQVSKLQTEVFTISYLVFFAILGTLGRVGLSALTSYPGAPVIFESIWPNFAGCLVMGFLAEDRMLFQTAPLPEDTDNIEMGRRKSHDQENGSSSDQNPNGDGMTPMQIKKTIPLYIGMATGFCGSLTSFSSFIRDAFLALSNDMVTPGVPNSPTSRNGGYSFMALLAVIILTITLSLSALFIGAHIAIAVERFTLSIRYPITKRILDPAAVVLGWGSWIGAVFLAIFPPHDFWRGRAVFAIVFAPLGCLLRFYVSLHLNGMAASFPVGTFVVNVFGTGVLGMAWDIAHAQVGGVIGCQVLQGIEDGFCGALTTVSTWVAELSSLRRKHAYTYGTASVVVSLLLLIGVMGGLRWSDGFKPLLCST